VPLKDSALAVLVTVIWGLNFVVIDEGLGDVPPLLFVALRFAVVLVPAVFLVPRPAVPWRTLATVGLFLSAGQFGLLYTALAVGMPAGLASLVLQAQVLFSVALAAGVLHERPTGRQVAGTLIGLGGLAVVAAGRSAETPWPGLLLALAAALSWASGNIASRQARVASGLSMTVWSALFVPVPLFVLALVVDGPAAVGEGLLHLGPGSLLSTAYTAILASLVGYGIWNTLLARHAAARVVPFTLLVPPIGILTAWLVQGERPGPAEVAGGAVLLVGVAVAVLRPPSAQPEEVDGGEVRGQGDQVVRPVDQQHPVLAGRAADRADPGHDVGGEQVGGRGEADPLAAAVDRELAPAPAPGGEIDVAVDDVGGLPLRGELLGLGPDPGREGGQERSVEPEPARGRDGEQEFERHQGSSTT
jgi:O-acetylserine/cysteine efflux transporter